MACSRSIMACLATAIVACGGGVAGNRDAAEPIDAVVVTIDAAPSLTDMCGAPGAGWTRCAADPLVSGFRANGDGRVRLTQADPSIMYDADDHLWKAWWSTVITNDCMKIPAGTDVHEIDIEYAESPDGLHWTVQEALALDRSAPTAWDYSTTETPTVVKDPSASADHRYAMLYAGGNDADLKVLGQTGWQLGLAYSADGKHFTRAAASYTAAQTPFQDVTGLLLLAKDAFPAIANQGNGIAADPEIVKRGATYHLFFSSLAIGTDAMTVLAYGISHATSTDLVHWTMAAGNPVIGGGSLKGTPAVLDTSGTFEMWFHADSMADLATVPSILFPTLGGWRATSTDGDTWTDPGIARDFTWDSSRPFEHDGLLRGLAVVRDPTGPVRMYYSAWGSSPAPTGSCVYTQSGTVPGTDSLSLALRAE